MASERTHSIRWGGAKRLERHAGPSAARIADLMPHRVSFDRGWFWTTTAIHHGEGIDPR